MNRSYSTAMHSLVLLRENPDGIPVHLFASHADPDSPVLAAADTVVPEPAGVGEVYAHGALELCAEKKIDVFWPTWHAPALAVRRRAFASAGTALLACDLPGLALCTDKARVYAALAGTRVPVPCHHVARTPEDLYLAFAALRRSGQVCVKPLTGAGAVGFRILRDVPADAASLFGPLYADAHVDDVAAALDHPDAPPLLVMPLLPGPELSVDVLARDGVLLGGLIRCKRDGVRSVEVIDDPAPLALAADIVAALGLSMLVNIQFRFDDRGRPMLLEVNARASGGLYQTAVAGWNLAWAAVRLLLDGEVTLPLPRVPQRLVTVPSTISLGRPA